MQYYVSPNHVGVTLWARRLEEPIPPVPPGTMFRRHWITHSRARVISWSRNTPTETIISCTVGNAVADGVTASIRGVIACTPGNAVAAGVTANVTGQQADLAFPVVGSVRKKKKKKRDPVEILDYSTVNIPEEVRALFVQQTEQISMPATITALVLRDYVSKKQLQDEDLILLMY